MSRIGNIPVLIPNNVFVKKQDNIIYINGPLGKLNKKIIGDINIIINNNNIIVKRKHNDKKNRALHGLYRMLIYNMIKGVYNGFKKKLELIGVGFRANINKNNSQILYLNIGYSHNIIIKLPKSITLEVKMEKNKNTQIILKSYDKQLLGIVAAKIRSLRKPDPYKGKGIRYINEYVIKKTGKSAK
ncbi:50S ribosomal protein L6 [Candidatus Karelsulcia muelleri]|uniref:50S ribosomal protein L6 n=1 Tax=Candidatus Karelsulcia muelleri TaxID=336810 RepID=UPI000B92CD6E|nr:50S ribosomal protein L6 [Candidatus Karelsulcia muelleri]ASS46981.1 50S ribosomal protein L6 [Candidatus Karelsulcia muelleri]